MDFETAVGDIKSGKKRAYSSRHADQARTRKYCAQLYLRREGFGLEYKIL